MPLIRHLIGRFNPGDRCEHEFRTIGALARMVKGVQATPPRGGYRDRAFLGIPGDFSPGHLAFGKSSWSEAEG